MAQSSLQDSGDMLWQEMKRREKDLGRVFYLQAGLPEEVTQASQDEQQQTPGFGKTCDRRLLSPTQLLLEVYFVVGINFKNLRSLLCGLMAFDSPITSHALLRVLDKQRRFCKRAELKPERKAKAVDRKSVV